MPAWSKVCFDEDARHIAIFGGRGSSKSHSVARALLVRGSNKTLRIACAREFQESIHRSVKRVLDDLIKQDPDLSSFYTSTDREIRGENGTLFMFVGLNRNIDSVKSMEGVDVCWVEEAQSISQRSIDVLVPTIRKPGSQIIWVWNPTNEHDPVDKMFRDPENPPAADERLVPVNFSDNPWFKETPLQREMERDKTRDPDRFLHIWLGGYLKRSKAAVFTDFRMVTTATAPEIPLHATPRLGADWGFSPDPTVLVRCWVLTASKTIYVDREAYQSACEIEDTPDLFREIENSEKFQIVADNCRPETISYVKRHGFPKIVPAVKGPNSVEEGVEFLVGYTILIHESCVNTFREVSLYKRKVDPHTGEILSELEDKDNHVIDALRYAVESDRRTPPVRITPKVTIIPTRTAWAGRRA